jgi:hypothetical protein
VNTPSSCCPENQRKADTAKEILTAKRIKKSDCLNIFLLLVLTYSSKNPIAAERHPNTATAAILLRPEWPKNSNSWNVNIPSITLKKVTRDNPIRKIPV